MFFEHNEAILYRLLAGFFGEECVIPQMSVLAVCGGELPSDLHSVIIGKTQQELFHWAKGSKCLFTVVNHEDTPKLVVEFFSGYKDSFTTHEVEHQQFLKPILEQARIQYITISNDEFEEIVSPSGSMDFFHWLQSKILTETSLSIDS